MQDAMNHFTSQSVTGTAAVILEGHIDLGVARKVGTGQALFPYIYATAVSGTSPTAIVEVFEASDLAGAGLEVLCRSAAAKSLTGAAAATPVHIPIPPLGNNTTRLRYLGFRVTLAGTSPTATFEYGVTPDQKISGPTVSSPIA